MARNDCIFYNINRGIDLLLRCVILIFIATLSFHQTPQDQLVLTRSSVVLSCITEGGDPSPVVFWAHNDDALIDSKETSIVNDSLIIREVSLKHDGVYTCYATNGLMTITADAELVVEERKGKNITVVD